jgi:hypothetical protein
VSEPKKRKGRDPEKSQGEHAPIYPAARSSDESELREIPEAPRIEVEAFYNAEEVEFVNKIARSAAESIAKQK